MSASRARSEGDTSYAADDVARLLADPGHTEEAAAVQHVPDHRRDLAGYLIDLGRIDDAVALLRQHVLRPTHGWGGPWHGEPSS